MQVMITFLIGFVLLEVRSCLIALSEKLRPCQGCLLGREKGRRTVMLFVLFLALDSGFFFILLACLSAIRTLRKNTLLLIIIFYACVVIHRYATEM